MSDNKKEVKFYILLMLHNNFKQVIELKMYDFIY